MARTPTQVGPGDPLDDGRSGGPGAHGGSEHDARAAELLHLEYERGLESDEGRWSDPREFESHLSERGESPSVEVWEVFLQLAIPPHQKPGWYPQSRIRHGDAEYRLTRFLGRGGFGEVWEATEARPIERRVALKFLDTTRSKAQAGSDGRLHRSRPQSKPPLARPHRAHGS